MKAFILMALLFTYPLFAETAAETKKQTPEIEISPIIQSFEEYVNNSMLSWNVPGLSIAIVKDDKTIYSKGFGVKKIDSQDKVDTHTLFQIGSLSKSFTSALVALMVDEGRLKWNDDVIDHFPDFMLYDPWVTREFQVQDLLCQRSGLPPFAGDLQSYLGYSAKQIISSLRYIKPATSFRSTYAFQNSFFLVAGEVLKRVSGRSWEDLVEERIFYPLGMSESSSSLESYKAGKNVSSRHIHVNKKTKVLSEDDPTLEALYTYGPAGGINSTAEDMAQWLKLQINKGSFNDTPLIGAKDLIQTHRRYIYMGKLFNSDNYYCLGWSSRDYSPYSIIWHDGGASGSSSLMAFIPEEKLGLVILSNTKGTSLNYALAWEFFDLYYKKTKRNWSEELLEKQMTIGDTSTITALEKPQPPLSLGEYTGVYYNKMYGMTEITQEDDHLVLTLGPKKVQLILKPWNRDNFTLLWPQVEDIINTKVFFSKDVNGYPTQMEIEVLEQNSDGTFKRLGEE